jgi:hypothetical protein
MENSFNIWWAYALLSAFFAALTTIFAKIGIENVDANLATAVRTVVIVFIAWDSASAGQSQPARHYFHSLSRFLSNFRCGDWLILDFLLSGTPAR